jgi:hypothetical protein
MAMTVEQPTPRLPPWLSVRAAWVVHRAIYRITNGRRGVWKPKANAFGTMRVQRQLRCLGGDAFSRDGGRGARAARRQVPC